MPEPIVSEEVASLLRALESDYHAMQVALSTCIVNLRRWADGKPDVVDRKFYRELLEICEDAYPKRKEAPDASTD